MSAYREITCLFAVFFFLFQNPVVSLAQVSRKVKMEITSSRFQNGEIIPKQYTCDGSNVSPPLSFKSVPANAKSLALICDDPDAPGMTFVHWVVYNISPQISELEEALPKDSTLSNGLQQGTNSFPEVGYNGPCPPSGTHRYFFKLYALDATISLDKATKKQLLEAMKGHILAEAKLVGKYKR